MFRLLRRFLPFLIAGTLGTAAVIVMQRYLVGERRQVDILRKKLMADFENPIELIVARQDIPEGATITPAHLERVSIPPKFAQPYATTRAADAVGMVARVPMSKGEQVMLNKLARPEAPKADKLAGVTPSGKRAITIGADVLTGVGGFIRPSDQVDILWTFQAPTPSGRGSELVTVTLFQDVQVLAIGTEMIGQEASEKPAQREYTVTLALAPMETELLLFAREQGQIALSLRSAVETGGLLAVHPANMSTVVEMLFGTTLPPEEPVVEPSTVELFRGLDRNLVTVNQ